MKNRPPHKASDGLLPGMPQPHVERRGTGGPPLVLVHGFGINRRSWYDVAPHLAARGTLHLVDLIGCGASPAPADWPYTIESQARALMAYLDARRLDDLVLVGHSYGGGVVLMLLYLLRERGETARVQRLVLLAPGALPQGLPFFVRLPRLPLIGPLLLATLPAAWQVRLTLTLVTANRAVVTAERAARYSGNLSSAARRAALVNTARNLLPPELEALTARLTDVDVPTLLLYGERERVIRQANLRRLARTLPAVTVERLPACGHLPHEEFPAATAARINAFLGREPRSQERHGS